MAEVSDAERSTAYHEAGHAAVSLAVCRPVRWVTIVPCEEYRGCCRAEISLPMEPVEGDNRWVIAFLRNHVLIFLGGPIAAFVHSHRQDFSREPGSPIPHWTEVAMDLSEIEESLLDLLVHRDGEFLPEGGTDIAAGRQRVFETAFRQVASNWWAVEAIAAALIDCGTIGGAAIDQALKTADTSRRLYLVERDSNSTPTA